MRGGRAGRLTFARARARAWLGLAVAAAAAVGPAQAAAPAKSTSQTVGADDFVVAKGPRLLLGGRPFAFVGANLSVTHGPENRAALVEVMDGAAADGLRVGRVWAFGEGAADASPWLREHFLFRAGADDWVEAAALHLDAVLAEARRHGLHLIVTLANQWSDYGGVPRYLEWSAPVPKGTVAVPAPTPTPAAALEPYGAADRFYSDPRARSAYRVHVERLLRRTNTITRIPYRDDPTILAWELINESTVATPSGVRGRRAWVREMATLIHALDPHHLVMSGVSGYRLGRERDEWLRVCRLPQIDVCDGHLYPEEALRDRDDDAVDAAIDDAVQLAQFVAGKPFILGEVGIHGQVGEPRQWRGRSRAEWLARVFRRLRLDGAAGGLVWLYQRHGGADGVHGIDVGDGGGGAPAGLGSSAAVRHALRAAAGQLAADGGLGLGPGTGPAVGGEPASVETNPRLGKSRGTLPILPLHAEVAGTAQAVARPEPWSEPAPAPAVRALRRGWSWTWDPGAFSRADWESSGFYAGGKLAHVWGTETGFFEYAFEVPSAEPEGVGESEGARTRSATAWAGRAGGVGGALELEARLSSEYPGDTSPPEGASAFVVDIDGLRLGAGLAVRDDGAGARVLVRMPVPGARGAREKTVALVRHLLGAPGRHALRLTVLPGRQAHGLCIYGALGANPKAGAAPAHLELRMVFGDPPAALR